MTIMRASPLIVLLLGCATSTPTPPEAAQKAPRLEYAARKGPRLRLAVMEFKEELPNQEEVAKLGWLGKIAPLVRTQALGELARTRSFVVLERQSLDQLKGEIDLASGADAAYFDQSSTARKGRWLGAQAAVVGVITAFEPARKRSEATLQVGKGAAAEASEEEALVTIAVRIVDVETGKVEYTGSATGRAVTRKAEGHASYLGLKLGGSVFDRTPLGQATGDAVQKAVAEVLGQLPPSAFRSPVLKVGSRDAVTIGGGADLGVKKGDRFALASQGEPLVDPATGKRYGNREVGIAVLEITDVGEKSATGRLVCGRTPELGDVAGYDEAAPAEACPTEPTAAPRPPAEKVDVATVQALLDQGKQLFRAGRHDEAARAFRDAWERERVARSKKHSDDILYNVAAALDRVHRASKNATNRERVLRAYQEVLGSQASPPARERAQARIDELTKEPTAASP